jgi:ABC-type branched-subunit amino acid transport system substrate-binding protein
MIKFSPKILIGILFAVSLGPVWAHSFNLGFIIPLSGPQLEAGQQALDGFMLATTEEDGHPDETSDGHLGGLDSHLFKVDSGADSTVMLKRLENLVQTREPIFVTGLFTAETSELVEELLKRQNTVLFDPAESAMWQIVLTAPKQLKSMSGDPFSALFQNRYGYAPTSDVMRGYIAARLIAATVRSLPGEQVGKSRELALVLTRFQRELR